MSRPAKAVRPVIPGGWEPSAKTAAGTSLQGRAALVGAGVIPFSALALFAGWLAFHGSKLRGGVSVLPHFWPYVLGACLAVGALAGVIVGFLLYCVLVVTVAMFDHEGR
jgi:hypothetical protein